MVRRESAEEDKKRKDELRSGRLPRHAAPSRPSKTAIRFLRIRKKAEEAVAEANRA